MLVSVHILCQGGGFGFQMLADAERGRGFEVLLTSASFCKFLDKFRLPRSVLEVLFYQKHDLSSRVSIQTTLLHASAISKIMRCGNGGIASTFLCARSLIFTFCLIVKVFVQLLKLKSVRRGWGGWLCWRKQRGGGHAHCWQLLTEGEGCQKCQKVDDVICERSLQ